MEGLRVRERCRLINVHGCVLRAVPGEGCHCVGGRLILNIVGVIDIAIGWARVAVTNGGLFAVNVVDVGIGITVQRGTVITIVGGVISIVRAISGDRDRGCQGRGPRRG